MLAPLAGFGGGAAVPDTVSGTSGKAEQRFPGSSRLSIVLAARCCSAVPPDLVLVGNALKPLKLCLLSVASRKRRFFLRVPWKTAEVPDQVDPCGLA